MNVNTTQKERVIQFIEKQGISKNKFYNQTGVSNGTLDKKSGITGDTIAKIYAAYPDLNLEWLITGEGDMTKSSVFSLYGNMKSFMDKYASAMNIDPSMVSEKTFLEVESPSEFVPIFSYNDKRKFNGYLSIPNVEACDGASFVKTDSMYPMIKPGDIVCFKSANNTKNIHWGEMYIVYIVIDGEDYLTIKNIERSELGKDYVRLTGYNTKYQPKDVPVEAIQWKAIIKASINYNSVL
ncbi:LexA family transcriptional regulator [Prevotella sp. 10(H)]|uniref:S24 family peptidase n=1 Tax=Prevotella sp. 10(H) TaxID=1158294 RepID=UPI0004A6E8DD|nr:LexA family transcriptional regulator [Prevotella sp. 10(H)]